ncbi:hypothetical protein AVEN_37538-1 [Araneus ventricosus]|uniref:Uncharacterized protein n=1 Tax=Araneus ventricosus TaxID=182803 RepID=A0A4Y2L6S1_ARAVE|nr:hypothetical protein AVEN_37538-1 [Araneus ventricosus]
MRRVLSRSFTTVLLHANGVVALHVILFFSPSLRQIFYGRSTQCKSIHYQSLRSTTAAFSDFLFEPRTTNLPHTHHREPTPTDVHSCHGGPKRDSDGVGGRSARPLRPQSSTPDKILSILILLKIAFNLIKLICLKGVWRSKWSDGYPALCSMPLQFRPGFRINDWFWRGAVMNVQSQINELGDSLATKPWQVPFYQTIATRQIDLSNIL